MESDDSISLMKECVAHCIHNWSSLNLAIQMGFRKKNKHLVLEDEDKGVLFQKLKHGDESKIIDDYIEELTQDIMVGDFIAADIEDSLLDYVEDNFYLQPDDESEKQIAEILITAKREIEQMNDQAPTIIRLRELNEKMLEEKAKKDEKERLLQEELERERQEELAKQEAENPTAQVNTDNLTQVGNTFQDDDGFTVITGKKKK